MLLGSTNFFTFDGLIYNHIGRCVHLLTADLVDGNFSVSLQFEPGDSSDADFAYNIIVASGHNTLIIDMKEDVSRSFIFILIISLTNYIYSGFSGWVFLFLYTPSVFFFQTINLKMFSVAKEQQSFSC